MAKSAKIIAKILDLEKSVDDVDAFLRAIKPVFSEDENRRLQRVEYTRLIDAAIERAEALSAEAKQFVPKDVKESAVKRATESNSKLVRDWIAGIKEDFPRGKLVDATLAIIKKIKDTITVTKRLG